MSSYQGKATRMVPQRIVDDLRDQIESSVPHLIDQDSQDARTRYAMVNRRLPLIVYVCVRHVSCV